MREVTIAAIQMSCSRDVKENIEKAAKLIRAAAEAGAQIILPSELFERQYFCQERRYDYYDYAKPLSENDAVQSMKALDAGADLVNDIWGLKYDPDLAGVIARKNAPCCLMHNRKEPDYTDFIADFLKDMQETIDIAKKAGIADENIILDPGVGFGKTYENNLEIINKLECMHTLGYPILLGTSRKSVIGLTLDLPADQRMEGTVATTVIGVMKGVAFVRVHDVKENYRALKMTEAILGR